VEAGGHNEVVAVDVGCGSSESARNGDEGVSPNARGCATSSNGGARGSFNRCR